MATDKSIYDMNNGHPKMSSPAPSDPKSKKEDEDEDAGHQDNLGEPDGSNAATNDHARSQITNSDDSSQDWERRNL